MNMNKNTGYGPTDKQWRPVCLLTYRPRTSLIRIGRFYSTATDPNTDTGIDLNLESRNISKMRRLVITKRKPKRNNLEQRIHLPPEIWDIIRSWAKKWNPPPSADFCGPIFSCTLNIFYKTIWLLDGI
jgi:hypothetical protein